MKQQIRFCRSFDGARIAYAVTGSGMPLVRAPHWLTHLEYEFESPVWKPWIESLSQHYALLRMDERAWPVRLGCRRRFARGMGARSGSGRRRRRA